jgi:hypothetical protein
MLFFYLVNEFKEKKINYFGGEKGNYIVYFSNGRNSRGGMDMGSPDQMVVQKVNAFNPYL